MHDDGMTTKAGIPTQPIPTGPDAAGMDPAVTRQYNDDESKDTLWACIDDIYALLEDEAEANHGYADFLEKHRCDISEAQASMIFAIMCDEEKHMETLREFIRENSCIKPSQWVLDDAPTREEVMEAKMVLDEAPDPEVAELAEKVNEKIEPPGHPSELDDPFVGFAKFLR